MPWITSLPRDPPELAWRGLLCFPSQWSFGAADTSSKWDSRGRMLRIKHAPAWTGPAKATWGLCSFTCFMDFTMRLFRRVFTGKQNVARGPSTDWEKVHGGVDEQQPQARQLHGLLQGHPECGRSLGVGSG